jgi:hypothetical protein
VGSNQEAYLLDIARRIVGLETEFTASHSLETAKQIARLEAEYARVKGDKRPFSPDAVIEKGLSSDLPSDGGATYWQRIEAALNRSSTPMTAQDICAAIGEPAPLPTVRAILSKMIGNGVERVSTGLYRSAQGAQRQGAADDD